MPKAIKPLSPKELDATRVGDKLYDGGGLMLHHRPSGREWFVRYRYGDKRRDMPLGKYPALSLKAARGEREMIRAMIAKGIDPIGKRGADKAAAMLRAENSFETVAREWLKMKSASWVATTTTKNTTHLETYLFPSIGARAIADVSAPELLAALKKVEQHASYTATRLREMVGQIFRFGIITGRCERNPAADLAGALKSPTVVHRPAITDRREFAQFLQDLDAFNACEPVTKSAAWYNLLTFVRPGEFRFAQWDEIDWDAAEWKVPAKRMKVGKNLQAHTVPLATQAITVLRFLQTLTGSTPYLFPKAGGSGAAGVISENSVGKIIERMGYKGRQSSHGFRATARSLLSERGWSFEAMERQLDHAERSRVVAAYARSQYLDERRRMMQDWADMVDAMTKPENNVVPIKAA
jgi:integrase